MSILDIVRYHGHNVSPFVEADGRVRFVSDATGAASHAGIADGASGLRVKPHTFHGGTEPADSEPSAWWTEPGALDRDRAAVEAAFPGFIEISHTDRPPSWRGTIDSGAGRFEIEIQHRRDRELPLVIPIAPRKRHAPSGRGMVQSPHLYVNGNLCVADREDWDPSTDTVATVIAWAAHWHAAYVVWRASRRWPSEGYQPDAA